MLQAGLQDPTLIPKELVMAIQQNLMGVQQQTMQELFDIFNDRQQRASQLVPLVDVAVQAEQERVPRWQQITATYNTLYTNPANHTAQSTQQNQ